MKITILVPDLSNNCLGRAYLLGEVLKRHYEVEMGGIMMGERVWPPFDTGHYDYFKVPYKPGDNFRKTQEKLMGMITGDVIYASKVMPASFGTALLKKKRDGTPVVLDNDDWQLAMLLRKPGLGYLRDLIGRTVHRKHDSARSAWRNFLLERKIKKADAVTTVSRFLQKRSGGVMVPHGKDTDQFDPAKFNRAECRRKLGLDQEKVVMFLGTPRPQKGLEELIEAVNQSQTRNILLVIAGMDQNASGNEKIYQDSLRQLASQSRRLKLLPMCPFEELPRYLIAADLVVLPQRGGKGMSWKERMITKAQIPAKIFDAMALERPIIATDTADLAEILESCGYIVPPGDIKALQRKIDYVFSHYSEALQLGKVARQKCIRQYSWDAMGKTLVKIFDQFK
jgi:glycosyltransferase involved in cell wall biosynthesis